jgi:hypothetical protein
MAGSELLTTSSRDMGAARLDAGDAADAAGVVHASGTLKGPGVDSWLGASGASRVAGCGVDAGGAALASGAAGFRAGTIWMATSAPMAIAATVKSTTHCRMPDRG